MAQPWEWRVAYARQAQADLLAREVLLNRPDVPECQQLHFLQMACEKICKAYLCGQGTDPQVLRRGHGYISGPLPVIVREQLARESRRMHASSWLVLAIGVLARQIELLAPAIDDDGRHPANCEYPWEDHRQEAVAPADHNFDMNLLHERAGRYLLKVLYATVRDLMQNQWQEPHSHDTP